MGRGWQVGTGLGQHLVPAQRYWKETSHVRLDLITQDGASEAFLSPSSAATKPGRYTGPTHGKANPKSMYKHVGSI